MSGIPEATPIGLTEEERAELEGLARSTKTEYRLRQRARIVLLAAGGMASRAIGREVGCTTGTASKWRVRYARDRLAARLTFTAIPVRTSKPHTLRLGRESQPCLRSCTMRAGKP